MAQKISGRLSVSVDPELLLRFKQLIIGKYGILRGAFSGEIEDAIRERVERLEEEMRRRL